MTSGHLAETRKVMSRSPLKRFTFNLAEIESAIVLHKIDNFIELLIYETGIV